MSLPAPHWDPPSGPAAVWTPELAAFWRRIAAYAVDVLVFAVPAFFYILATTNLEDDDAVGDLRTASLVFSAAFTLYQTIMFGRRGCRGGWGLRRTMRRTGLRWSGRKAASYAKACMWRGVIRIRGSTHWRAAEFFRAFITMRDLKSRRRWSS